MVGALVVPCIACGVDRVAGVGLGTVLVLFEFKVLTQIVEFDVTVYDEALGHVLQTRHPQSEVPFGVRGPGAPRVTAACDTRQRLRA